MSYSTSFNSVAESYPDIQELYKYREFQEIYSEENLLEENMHMKRYQILPIRYMTNNNEVVKRFLIYHSPGTGKSFTALWILLNFIDIYEKPSIILVKSKEAIIEFKQRISLWYTYTFNYRTPPTGITNYHQFIKRYIEFYTYITFCKSIDNIKDITIYENRLLIIDEIHHFRNTVGNKIIYNKLLKILNNIKNSRVLFMSATPIFDNYSEITSLVKLMKPDFNFNIDITPEILEEIMKGHVSYYGLNPPDTSVNFMGSYVPGIKRFKILKVPMKGLQLENYENLINESESICNIGISHVKASLGVIGLIPEDSNNNVSIKDSRYALKNECIINNNPNIQNIIIKQAKNLETYCCKLHECLKIINDKDSPDGPVFIYCNIIDDVGIYYFAALLCAMGYRYIYDSKSALKYGQKLSLNENTNYPELKEMRMKRNKKKWNFTFVTGDKRLCQNVTERLSIFNDINNKHGTSIKVLLGSDILSESVDIMNVRQLHIITPHWNYEKINQIIGRIRRVGSHDALPPHQRNVNIYLYMAYNPDSAIEYENSINYSIDYIKYIISEKKYSEARKYNEALQNASIESLICKSKTNANTDILDNFQYSKNYLNKYLSKYLIIACSEFKNVLNSYDYISVNDFKKKIPTLNSFMMAKIIDIIKTNNIIINNKILEYSCGLFYLEASSNTHFCYNMEGNTESIISINSSISENLLNNSKNENILFEINEENMKMMEKLLDNNLSNEFYDNISKLTYTNILEILKYSLKFDLKNIKNLLYPYWLKYKGLFYIFYFSSIKNTSYASNKKRSINDFNNIIIYSDSKFENWTLLKDDELKNLSIIFQKHYNEETSKRINHRMKYVYILCNDFTLRYRDLCNNLNLYSTKKDENNLRNINRGRSIDNFYDKKELIELLVYSVCFDNLESELSFTKNYKEISVSDITSLLINNINEYTDLIEHILSTVTNNNIDEYCCKRPHQTFLLYTLLSSIPYIIKMTRNDIIDIWKYYLFSYNLIVIL